MQSIFLSSSVTVNTSSSFLVYCLPIIKNKTQRAKNKAKRNKWQLHLPTLLKGSKKYIYKLFLLQISFQIKTGGFNLSHMVCKALEFLDVFYFLKFFRVSDVTLRAPIYCKKHLLAHLKSSCWQTKNTLIICRNILFEYNAISQDLQWTWNYFQGIYKNNSLNNLNEVTKSILTLNNSFYSELKLINTEPIPVSWSGGTTSTKKIRQGYWISHQAPCKAHCSYIFFFYLGFLSRTFTNHIWEGICLSPHYHFHPLHRHLNISQAINAESSPLHIAINCRLQNVISQNFKDTRKWGCLLKQKNLNNS